MRFPIRIDAIWRAPLLAGGATARNSYVALTDEGVHFRFGLLFNRTIPYEQVNAAFPRSWPLLYGVGWRSNLRGVIGLIGSYHDVVEVRLKTRSRAWALIFPCDRIAVSLEDPERFVEALSERLGKPVPADVSALARPRRSPQRAKVLTPNPSPERGRGDTKAAPKAATGAAKANGSKAASPPKAAPRKAAAARKPAARSAGRTPVRARRSRPS